MLKAHRSTMHLKLCTQCTTSVLKIKTSGGDKHTEDSGPRSQTCAYDGFFSAAFTFTSSHHNTWQSITVSFWQLSFPFSGIKSLCFHEHLRCQPVWIVALKRLQGWDITPTLITHPSSIHPSMEHAQWCNLKDKDRNHCRITNTYYKVPIALITN